MPLQKIDAKKAFQSLNKPECVWRQDGMITGWNPWSHQCFSHHLRFIGMTAFSVWGHVLRGTSRELCQI